MRIKWLQPALEDLQRLKDFILPHNREAARRAIGVIRATVLLLNENPRIGKPVENLPDNHDLIIPFGSAGYVLRYRIQGDTAFIIAVKHGKEAGFATETESGWVVNDPVAMAWGCLADGGPSAAEELLAERRRDTEREQRKFGIGGAEDEG